MNSIAASSRRRAGCGANLVLLASILWFAFFWWSEVWDIVRYLIILVWGIATGNIAQIPSIFVIDRPLILVGAALLGLGTAYLLALNLVSFFALPCRTFLEGRYAAWRLFCHFIARHGPAAIVAEGGQPVSNNADAFCWPGAVRVDAESAVVFEKPLDALPSQMTRGVPPGQPLIAGPGLTFTQPFEKIRGVVSLRSQFRTARGIEVKGYTSDGVQVETSVYAVFSINQPPQVLTVAHTGPFTDEIRVLRVDRNTHAITDVVDELDADDRIEIADFASGLNPPGFHSAAFYKEPETPEIPPYTLDEDRLWAAVFRQAEDAHNHTPVDWTQAPVLAAIEVFRQVMNEYTFDQLFFVDSAGRKHPPELARQRFNHRMRNLGVLSYQYVARRDGKPAEKGQILNHNNFITAPVRPLRAPKVLRNCGIKVINSGYMFLDFDEEVTQQRIDNWRAGRQRDMDNVRADYDREVILIRGRARAEAQHRIVYSLSQALNSSPSTEEALAIRLFQALEDAAADPETHQFMPTDTIRMLRTLGIWLLPDRNGLSTSSYDAFYGDGI